MKSRAFIIKFYVSFICFILISVSLVVFMHRWLMKYTEHGIEIKVPDLMGISEEEARILLHSMGLEIQIVDSTFSRRLPLNSIVDQLPLPNSNVKHGRIIYVVVNASQRPKVKLPNVINLSYRQAVSVLHAINIEVNDIRFVPSKYRNLLLQVLQNDLPVQAGEDIEEGSSVELLVGLGSEKRYIPAPNLIGKTKSEVKTILLQHLLSLDSCFYEDGEIYERMFVYQQWPEVGQPILEGQGIHLWFTDDETKIPSESSESFLNNKDEEETDKFF